MGNTFSTNTNINIEKLKMHSIDQVIDYIASHYILTTDFKGLKKLYDLEYCNNLVVLTSDILERHFTSREVTYISERVKHGVSIDESLDNSNKLEKDNMVFFDKNKVEHLDIPDPVKKKHVCLGIAKFYVKIAHVFAAIAMAINPVYSYTDHNGDEQTVGLFEKNKIPHNVPIKVFKSNMCHNRIEILKNKTQIDLNGINDEEEININPKICSTDSNKSLNDVPGIPELYELYLDDEYDFDTGRFMGMSPQSKKMYEEDLQIFYNIFTDDRTGKVPETIKQFKDIKLTDYAKSNNCQGDNAKLKTKIRGKKSNTLIVQYAEHLKQMIKRADENQQKLFIILNQIFVYTIEPETERKVVRVSPYLKEDVLQTLIIETRSLLIKLYLTCEIDYVNGIKLYEAIVDKQILETAQNQIINLEKKSDSLITSIPEPAESIVLKNIELDDKNNPHVKDELTPK